VRNGNDGDSLVRAYFVRVAADRQVVGLFVAPSIVTLATLVDECCDPDSCEYAPAGMGGMLVERPTRATWPLSDPAQNDRDGAYEFATGLEDAALTQHWENDLRITPNHLEWKPLTSAMPSILRAVERKSVETSERKSDPDEKM
jgi:hypothetical protein